MADEATPPAQGNIVLRHEHDASRERSACGHRHRLISKGDKGVSAWAHTVDIDGARAHYHKRATELYYVLEGEGSVTLDGNEQKVFQNFEIFSNFFSEFFFVGFSLDYIRDMSLFVWQNS